MSGAQYTPAVKRIAEQVRGLTIGELLALKEALEQDFDLGIPPDIGTREPRTPLPSGGEADAVAERDE